MKEENEEDFASFQTNHSGIVNKIEFNFNGNKFATCGNDGKINIFSTEKIFSSKNNILPEVELIRNGHNKPISDLSFSHQNYGNYLASCGNDKKLIIWKEKSTNNYENIFEYKHKSPVKCCKFAPYQDRLIIICGTSDGSISLHELQKNFQKFNSFLFENVHMNGINAIDWLPISPPIYLEEENEKEDDDNINYDNFEENLPMKFISCGNDSKINIFESKENNIETFFMEKTLNLTKGIIPIDIAFLNFIGYTDLTFACGLNNGECVIYKWKDEEWKDTYTIDIGNNIIKICWSVCGTYLGISSKNGNVNDKASIRFFRENMDETWIEVK